MNSRGASTIRSLGRVFNTFDRDGNRRVDPQEFFVGLNECGCNLTKDETNELLAYLDTNSDGTVNYEEFLVAIRGQLNEARRAVVQAAFAKFDIDGSRTITASDLKPVYNTSSHPRVVSGDITDDEAFLEFLANFADRNNDGRITCTEWADYYSAVSSAVDNDDNFISLVQRSWGLN